MHTSTTLQVEGVHCPKCVARIRSAAEGIGVLSVSVSEDWKEVTFTYEAGRVEQTTLEKLIEDVGFALA